MKATITLKRQQTGEIITQEYDFEPRYTGEKVIVDAQLAYLTGGRREMHATMEGITVTDGDVVVARAERRMSPIGMALCPVEA
jgi:hypothetical protein